MAYIPADANKIRAKASEKASAAFTDKADIKLVIVGRITPSKGQLDAVRAVGLLKEQGILAELCIIGSIDDKAYYDEILQCIQKDKTKNRVIIEKYLTNPFPIVADADVGLTCSKLEAFGRTTFEYLVLHKPVIGTSAGGTKELVRDKKNGFLYHFGDAKSLAAHVKQYVKTPQLLIEHGKAADEVVDFVLQGPSSAAPLRRHIQKLIAQQHSPQKAPNFISQLVAFGPLANRYKIIAERNILRGGHLTQNQLKYYYKIHHSIPMKLARAARHPHRSYDKLKQKATKR